MMLATCSNTFAYARSNNTHTANENVNANWKNNFSGHITMFGYNVDVNSEGNMTQAGSLRPWSRSTILQKSKTSTTEDGPTP
jgi:hypothetical protein